METHTLETRGRRMAPGCVLALGTLVPWLIYLCAAAWLGLWPFGGNLMLEVDCLHQYLPFITDMRRKIVNGESLFFSFGGGLGYNLLATIAYYAASPLNYLTVLMPEAAVCDFMMCLILFKCSVSGGILAWYLYKREKADVPAALAFSAMYALCNYFLGYKFNIMWLDSIAVTPLVMYGLENLTRGKSGAPYIFSLFYAVWCNYYIGFMVCVFSVLYFLTLLIVEEGQTARTRKKSVGKFILCSLAAGGMASVLLLPTYLALKLSSSGVQDTNLGNLFYNNGLSMLFSHLEDSEVFRTSYERGQAHLYCGVIVFLLIALFFLNKSIRRKDRVSFGALLGFMLLSLTFAPLNFVWHGFHLQIGLPNRFAFLYIALLLKLCCRGLVNLKKISWPRFWVAVGAAGAVGAGLCLYRALGENSARAFISLGLILVYLGLLATARADWAWSRRASLAMCFVIFAEAVGHSLDDLKKRGAYTKAFYQDYQREFQQLLADQNETGFFRSEIDSTHIVNFAVYAGGNGVSLFNSTMSHNARLLFGGLNVSSGFNAIVYRGATKLVNDIMGVKYFLTANVSSDTWNGFKKVATLNGKNLYRNDEALSVGFWVPESVLDWKPLNQTGMKAQNDFVRLCTGVPELFNLQWSFFGRSGVSYRVDIPDGGMSYVDLEGAPEKIEWQTPEFTITYNSRTDLLLSAASTGPDQYAALTVTTKDDAQYNGVSYAWTDENYRQAIQALSAHQLENVTAQNSALSGAIHADEKGILLLTIPYDKGWQAELDGQPVKILEIGEALMGIALEAGDHTLSMRFVPPGFSAGAALSAASALLTCFLLLEERRKARKKTDEPAGETETAAECSAEALPAASEALEVSIQKKEGDAAC